MKTHLLLSTAILAAAFVFAGCKKKNKEVTTQVEGRVLTLGTNDPVINEPIHIRFLAHQYDYTFEVGETYTNDEGYFTFETSTDDNAITDYLIRLEDREYPNHNSQGGSIFHPRNKVPKGFQGTKNIYLAPHAWVRLHVKNINPQSGDRLIIEVWGGGLRRNFYGDVDTEYKVQTTGNADKLISYSLFRNGDLTTWHDTIFLSAFDTTFVKVEY